MACVFVVSSEQNVGVQHHNNCLPAPDNGFIHSLWQGLDFPDADWEMKPGSVAAWCLYLWHYILVRTWEGRLLRLDWLARSLRLSSPSTKANLLLLLGLGIKRPSERQLSCLPSVSSFNTVLRIEPRTSFLYIIFCSLFENFMLFKNLKQGPILYPRLTWNSLYS